MLYQRRDQHPSALIAIILVLREQMVLLLVCSTMACHCRWIFVPAARVTFARGRVSAHRAIFPTVHIMEIIEQLAPLIHPRRVL